MSDIGSYLVLIHQFHRYPKGSQWIDFSCFFLDEVIRTTNLTKNKKTNFGMFFKRTYSNWNVNNNLVIQQ